MVVLAYLDELQISSNKLAVRVTVLTKCCSVTSSMYKKSSMVFGDEKGSTIEAHLYEELESPNLITIDEGDWFEIKHFRVTVPFSMTRLTRNKYQIEMSNTSVVKKIQPMPFSNFFRFGNFIEINRGLAHPKYTIDLYGAMVGVGDIEFYQDEMLNGEVAGLNHRMQFSLINIDFVQVKCVAYGNIALQLHHYWNSTNDPVVLCVLRFWRIEWGEGRLNHVTNYEGFSKIIFEPEIPEIQAFRMRIPNPFY